jgi:hypothetical protein
MTRGAVAYAFLGASDDGASFHGAETLDARMTAALVLRLVRHICSVASGIGSKRGVE